MNKCRKEHSGHDHLYTLVYNLLLSFSILNLYFLSYTVVEISLPKNIERKLKENTDKNK